MAPTEPNPCMGQLQCPGILLSVFLLVTAALTGCGGDGTSVNSSSTGGTAGSPLSVHVTTDDTYTAQQALTAASGGTITATGADGTTYVLAIPAGALPADTTVSLTPIASISGLPLSGGLANGVQFGPEGLVLNTPATLTISPANPIPIAQLVGFGYTALGDHFHLEPTGGDGTTIIMAVPHFSGAGTAKGTAAEATALEQQSPPSSQDDILSEDEAVLVTQYREGQIPVATYQSEIGQAISDYYQSVINPQLTAGLNSDAAFTSGAQAALSFLRQLEITGLIADAPPNLESEITDLLKQGFLNGMDRLTQACTNTQDYSLATKIVASERQGLLLGFVKEEDVDFSKFSACLIFSVVPSPAAATVKVNGTQSYEVKLLNQQSQPLNNADAVAVNWVSENGAVASVVSQGNQQAVATGLQEGSTILLPSLPQTAFTATSLGIGNTEVGTATLTVTNSSDCTAYLSVKKWTVNIVASFSQKASGTNQTSAVETDSDSVSHELNYNFNISGGPTGVWQGSGATGQVSVADKNVASFTTGQRPVTTNATATGVGGGAALSSFTLTIDPKACIYSFAAEMNAEVTFTYDTGQPPSTTSLLGDGVRRAGDSLVTLASGTTPSITGQAQIPGYNVSSPQLGSNPNLSAYVPQLGTGPVLFNILGEMLGSSAAVSWTLTAVQ